MKTQGTGFEEPYPELRRRGEADFNSSVQAPDTQWETTSGHKDVVRLRSECMALESMAERLHRLVGNLHACQSPGEARLLVSSLYRGIRDHLRHEAAVLRGVGGGAPEGEPLAYVIGRTLTQHAIMCGLAPPVIRGLNTIGQSHLPTQLTHFVLEATIFCEFTRMHARFKRQRLYPLLAGLSNEAGSFQPGQASGGRIPELAREPKK